MRKENVNCYIKNYTMFKKIFNKGKKENKESDNSNENTINDHFQTFQTLLNSSLDKIGVDEKCNISKNDFSQKNEENHIKLLESLNYEDTFDKVVLKELNEYKKTNVNPSKSKFIADFFSIFHHKKIAEFTPEFIQSRNTKIESAYNSIIECINRIQGWLDNEKSRIKIESVYSNSPNHLSTIYQCTTPFCIISLGCDQFGRYNIVYTIDYRIKEIVGNDFASTLIRRIYDFTPGEIEPFVNINSLHGDCINTFEDILQLSKTERNHKITQKERFEGKSVNDELKKILRDDLDDETKK